VRFWRKLWWILKIWPRFLCKRVSFSWIVSGFWKFCLVWEQFWFFRQWRRQISRWSVFQNGNMQSNSCSGPGPKLSPCWLRCSGFIFKYIMFGVFYAGVAFLDVLWFFTLQLEGIKQFAIVPAAPGVHAKGYLLFNWKSCILIIHACLILILNYTLLSICYHMMNYILFVM